MRRPACILALILACLATAGVGSSQAAKATNAPPAACAEGLALERLGRLDAAEAAYLRGLGTPMSLECAAAGLARLGQRAQSCAPAAALEAAGERQAAHEAYVKVLSADPTSRCAKSGVEKTSTTTSFWSWVGTAAENTGKLLAAVVLALLTATILTLILLNGQTRWKLFPGLRDRWPANRIRRPTLQVGTFDDGALKEKLGIPTAGLIRGRISWRSKDRYGPNLISGQAGITSALDALGEISSETKSAVAVIKLLTATLPHRHFVLAGEMQPAGADGPGISLELTVREGYDSLVTFWANPLCLSGVEEVDAYQHLAIVAAAWVDHRLVNAIDGENLLSKDPRSWAFFASGAEWQRRGDYDRARQLYEQALTMDGNNVGALANLGIVEGWANNFEEAERLLKQAIAPTENPNIAPMLAPESNPDWFRIKYQLAGLYANWAAATDEPIKVKQLRNENAVKETRSLALSTSQTIQDESEQVPKPSLVQFLEGTIEPDALVLAASTLTAGTDLATPSKRPDRDQVIATLKANTINPYLLIAFVELGSNRSTDTSYNLACFYTIRNEFNEATQRLLEAIRETKTEARKGLVERSKQDPTLAPLFKRLPALLLKLEAAAGAKLSEGDSAEVAQFNLERTAIELFELEGWSMGWADAHAEFTLLGRRAEGEVLIALVKGSTISSADVNALVVARTTQAQDASDGEASVHLVLIAPDDQLPPVTTDPDVSTAISSAETHAVEVYGAGEQGLRRVTSSPA
jgi:tetratricopeptide (TPR) repeat protein